ncbi:MAG: transposase [Patescibacteria group bacterium]
MRKVQFANKEYYHIFNRGVDKRDIFVDQKDLGRFFQSMSEFNTLTPTGGIYAASFRKNNPLRNSVSKSEKLADFICYCLNPNHFHFMIQQTADRGIEKFMHRLGLGYSKYFNKKYERSGPLLQGPFKAVRIDSDEYLLHLSAYINLNNKVHGINSLLYKSSWEEYLEENGKIDEGFCKKDIVFGQFNNIDSYKNFAEESLKNIKERKELEKLLLE